MMVRQRTLILATTNPGKISEFRAILGSLIDLSHVNLAIAQDLGAVVPPIEEVGATFAENASIKAKAFAKATGLPALADDSGLCVDALGGAPGLYSSRWAGESKTDSDRVALLLERLALASPNNRTASFVCAAALAIPNGNVHVAEEHCTGEILDHAHGENGFGYDPIFFLPALGHTMAELSPETKNKISHRALALRHLAPALSTL